MTVANPKPYKLNPKPTDAPKHKPRKRPVLKHVKLRKLPVGAALRRRIGGQHDKGPRLQTADCVLLAPQAMEHVLGVLLQAVVHRTQLTENTTPLMLHVSCELTFTMPNDLQHVTDHRVKLTATRRCERDSVAPEGNGVSSSSWSRALRDSSSSTCRGTSESNARVEPLARKRKARRCYSQQRCTLQAM